MEMHWEGSQSVCISMRRENKSNSKVFDTNFVSFLTDLLQKINIINNFFVNIFVVFNLMVFPMYKS
jgi:hypothetical protein